MVQREMAKHGRGKKYHSSTHTFSSKIKCGHCGSWYDSKVWHSNSKYRKTIWQCNHKFNGDKRCDTPHLSDEDIQRLFLSAANRPREPTLTLSLRALRIYQTRSLSSIWKTGTRWWNMPPFTAPTISASPSKTGRKYRHKPTGAETPHHRIQFQRRDTFSVLSNQALLQ